MSDNKKDAKPDAELTDEEKKAKAEAEGLSEDELEGVSGGAGVAAARPIAVKGAIGQANPLGGGALGSYHVKTGPVFSKDAKSLPGGQNQGGGGL